MTGVSTGQVKILIVGLGSIGQRHARNLRSLLGSRLDLSVCRSRRRAGAIRDSLSFAPEASVEEELGARLFTSLDDALDDRPTAVFVCNPSSMHVPTAARAVEAGAHIFVEKPLSDGLNGVDRLLGLAHNRGVVAAIGCQMRFDPCLQRIHTLLGEGALGNIVSARLAVGEYLPDWHPYEDYRESYAAKLSLGGGVILTMIHELDVAYWFFGMPRSVYGIGGHLSRLELDVEDTASVLLGCARGPATIPVHVHMDYVQRPPHRTCEIVGDAGRLVADLRAGTVTVYGADGQVCEERQFFDIPRNAMFLAETRSFLHAIDTGEAPAVTLAEGADCLRIAVAAKDSIASGSVVLFPASNRT